MLHASGGLAPIMGISFAMIVVMIVMAGFLDYTAATQAATVPAAATQATTQPLLHTAHPASVMDAMHSERTTTVQSPVQR